LAQWDRLVERSPGSDVTQLSAWAAIKAGAGYSPIYLLAYQSNRIVGGALILKRRLFGLVSVGYLPYGPLVDVEAATPQLITTALIEEVAELAKSLTLTFVQPPEDAPEVSGGLIARGFRASHAGIAPAGSYRLDLTPPLDTIRSGFSKRLKSWTNRWEAKGVRVRQGDVNDLPLLLKLMSHTGERHSFAPPSLDHLERLYRELAGAGHAALFIGEFNGRPVSADLVTMIGGTIRGRRCGFDRTGDAAKLSVPAAVRWELIKWGKQHGYQWLDFGGLPEQMLDDMMLRGMRTSADWPSAHCSKLAFNGTPFRYPMAVEMVRPGLLRWMYDFATRHRLGAQLVTFVKNLLQANQASSGVVPSR
jgi:lipid II:glycine glycyltransferase (peptidoglycan interpeptide bridge formation enzyme)